MWFWYLDSRRKKGFEGYEPIACSEIESWLRLSGTLIRRDEIDMLIKMDNAYLGALAREAKERSEREKEKRSNYGSHRPRSPGKRRN